MKSHRKKYLIQTAVALAIILLAGNCLAFGGKVITPEGSPVVGAKVSLVGGGEKKETVFSDAEGKFQFSEAPTKEAYIQIKALDGKDYANTVLPAKLLAAGELAIILQPHGADQK